MVTGVYFAMSFIIRTGFFSLYFPIFCCLLSSLLMILLLVSKLLPFTHSSHTLSKFNDTKITFVSFLDMTLIDSNKCLSISEPITKDIDFIESLKHWLLFSSLGSLLNLKAYLTLSILMEIRIRDRQWKISSIIIERLICTGRVEGVIYILCCVYEIIFLMLPIPLFFVSILSQSLLIL